MARSKLLRTSKREILVSDKAKNAEILVCISSIFNEVWQQKILFEAGTALSEPPFLHGVFLVEGNYNLIAVSYALCTASAMVPLMIAF